MNSPLDNAGSSFNISIVATSFADRVAEAELGPTFKLEFTYLADLSPLLPILDAIDCFQHVCAATNVKKDIRDCMLPLWLHGHLKNDHRLMVAAFGPLRSEEISFRWPSFESWLSRFRAADLTPQSWQGFANRMHDKRLGFRAERVDLLADTISQTIYNRRLANQHADLHADKPSREINGNWREYSHELEAACEASTSIVEEKSAVFIPGDWRTYPPFFPGDRSTVRTTGYWSFMK